MDQLYQLYNPLQGRHHDWDGSLPQAAKTILHQHAIQGDINGLQHAMVRWKVLLLKSFEKQIDTEVMYSSLRDLERDWDKTMLGAADVEMLGDTFTLFVDVNLERIKNSQLNCSGVSKETKKNLDFTLRCLSYLSEMKAFAGCCPFHKEIRGELILSVKKGVSERLIDNLYN